jgi:superoxide dismutase
MISDVIVNFVFLFWGFMFLIVLLSYSLSWFFRQSWDNSREIMVNNVLSVINWKEANQTKRKGV